MLTKKSCLDRQALADQFSPGSSKPDSLPTHGLSFACAQEEKPPIVLINMARWVQKTSISRSKTYELMASDDSFPKPVRVGRRTLFVLHEVEAYLDALIAAGRQDSVAQ